MSSLAQTGFDCPRSLSQSDDRRRLFLDFHNELRRKIALGRQPNNRGFLGPARNMYELTWSCSLEQIAADQISSCTLSPRSDFAQNNIKVTHIKYREVAVLLLALKFWANQVKLFGVDTSNNGFKYTIEAFANMANSRTLQLGCAYKLCGSSMVVSCVYNSK
ncbi:SCP-like protein [Cooperia oncophora]